MRLLALTALSLMVFGGEAARAAEQTVPVVHTASARHSASERRTIIVSGTVDLPNSCWTNPRFQPPPPGAKADADGVVPITVVADSSEGPGVACAMIFRQGVKVPSLHWTHYPSKGLRAVKVIGSRTPVIAPIQTAGARKP